MADDLSRSKTGLSLLLSSPELAAGPRDQLESMGITVVSMDDPYAALNELLDRPLMFRAMVVSLQGLMPSELAMIGTARRCLPHLDVWLTHTDGRPAALAAAMRYGAAGFLTDDGLMRVSDGSGTSYSPDLAPPSPPATRSAITPARAAANRGDADDERSPSSELSGDHDHEPPSSSYMEDMSEDEDGQPILSAEELRALLADPPGSFGEA